MVPDIYIRIFVSTLIYNYLYSTKDNLLMSNDAMYICDKVIVMYNKKYCTLLHVSTFFQISWVSLEEE